MRSSTFARLSVALALVVGCGGGLKLTNIKNTQAKPSNVALYFKVQRSGGEPVGGLTADKFKIYEDDQLISEFESKQTILNPEVAASHYTLLLVDMSGSISESGSVDNLVEAATTFTERVEKSQKVGVFAFDGAEDLHEVHPFSAGTGAKAGVSSLKSFKSRDPSTNLNGAILKGLAKLDEALSRAEHPMRFGTLVVFSDGTDRAKRVKTEDAHKAIRDSKYDVFAIGLGAEMKEDVLKDFGKSGTARADDKTQVLKAFDAIAQKIEGATKSFYLLSYCSPARAGKHKLRIEARFDDGKEKSSGNLETDFDATGFGAGCDPKTPPSFDVSKGDALAPPRAPAAGAGAGSAGTGPVKLPPPPPPSPGQKPDVFNP